MKHASFATTRVSEHGVRLRHAGNAMQCEVRRLAVDVARGMQSRATELRHSRDVTRQPLRAYEHVKNKPRLRWRLREIGLQQHCARKAAQGSLCNT